MKLTNVAAYLSDDGEASITMSIDLGKVGVVEAVALFQSAIAPHLVMRSADAVVNTMPLPAVTDEQIADLKGKIENKRTRQTRAAVAQPTDQNVGQQELVAASDPTPATTRARPARTSTPIETVTEPAGPAVSDVDLAKAASNAASVIGHVKVLGLLVSLGVASVNDLKGDDQRQAFLDLVKRETALAAVV